MADDKFEQFKKRYVELPAQIHAIPPPIPLAGGAAGLARAAAGVVAKRGKDIVEGLTKAAKEPTKKTPRQVNAERGSRPLNKGAKRLQGKLEKMRIQGNQQRAESAASRNKPPSRAADSGTTAGRVRATAKRERTPREREQFGPLVPRRDGVPATQGTRAVTTQSSGLRAVAVRESGRRDMVPYKAQSRSVTARTFGDKGQGRIRPSATGRVAGVAPGASVGISMATQNAPNLGAGKTYAEDRRSKAKKPRTGGDVPRSVKTDRQPEKKVESKADAFRKKQQGMKVQGSQTHAKKVGKATDKSRVAKAPKPEKKMTNFERMKMRGYEKEGVAGRSVSPKRAKSRVMKERGYKFSDFFK